MIIISCKHGTARPMNYHLQTACPLKQAYTFSTIHTAQSNAILTRWRAHETKRTAPCVFCVFQPYRARPMANAGRGRVVEGYREGKTKWEGQARARKPRRRERQSSRSKTPSLTTVAVLYPYSYCTPPPHHSTILPPNTPSLPPPIVHVLYHHQSVSSQRRYLPSAFPWRRILLFVLPASSSCTTHPRRRTIPQRRFVQPLLPLIIVTAFWSIALSGRHPLAAESAETHPQRRLQSARPRELDLPGLVHGTLFVSSAALLPSPRHRTPSPRRGVCDRFTHAKQVLKGRRSRTGAQA